MTDDNTETRIAALEANCDRRCSLLEAAVARIMRDQNAVAAKTTTPSGVPHPAIPKWAEEWLDRWDSRGIPRARVAQQHECRKPGGDGKGDWSGDPTVRRDPPRWKDTSHAGEAYSKCPADYLLQLADFNEWKASKAATDPDADKRKFVTYNLRDAALCRGWAKLVADPVHRPGADVLSGPLDSWGAAPSEAESDANEDMPF